MAATRWFSQGREASSADIRFTLDEKRAEKKKRATALRGQMLARFKDEADQRKVGAAVRRAVREQERQLRTTIRAVVKPLSGGNSSARDRSMETLLGLSPARASTKQRAGLSSFHFKVRSRGFGERRQNRAHIFRAGETVNCLRYIIREAAREIAGGGLVSNISDDPELLAGFFAALEEFEGHNRSNAMVYMSAVVSLPHELTSMERERVLRKICAILARHDLGHVGVLHAPDPEGDQRNFHAHLLFSMRPIEALGLGAFGFSAEKHSDLNDASFLADMREEVAQIFNRAMTQAGHPRRFTHLSNAARGLTPLSKAEGKSTPGKKAIERKERDLARMRSERDIAVRLRSGVTRLLDLTARVAAWPARNFMQEAQHRVDALRKAPVNAGRNGLGTRVTSAKGPPLSSGAVATAIVNTLPDYRRDPLRVRTIADLVMRLDAESHLPLTTSGDRLASTKPHLTLAAVDKFDRRHDLFNAVAPFEDDDLIQAAFAVSRHRSLDAAEWGITAGRIEPIVPQQDLKARDFSRDDVELRQAILLMHQDAAFLEMIARVRRYWANWHAGERRRKVAEIEQARGAVIAAAEEVKNEEVLRPQPLDLPARRPDGAER